MNSIQLLIKEICEEEKISCHLISNDWILVLEKEDQIHYICGSHFDLNNYVSAKICNDKYACFAALQYHHIPVCDYYILYPDTPKEEVEECFYKYQENVVVKANNGSYGNHMFHVTDRNKLWNSMDILFQTNRSISMSPFYAISCEYRLIVLDGNVELIYGKRRPIIVGDGKHTIYELLCAFNAPFFQKLEDTSSLERVLDEGEEYEYGWQYNLSKGAIPFEVVDEELKKRLVSIAKEAVEKLNLRFVSVDIVELDSHDLKILEINSGVITNIANYFPDGERIAKEIYRKATLSMFQK